jgi:hypothetical protein
MNPPPLLLFFVPSGDHHTSQRHPEEGQNCGFSKDVLMGYTTNYNGADGNMWIKCV